MIEVIIGKCPSKSNAYRIVKFGGHASLAKTKDLKQYENDFAKQCVKYRNKNIEGEFKFEMDVYYPDRRADIDNSTKVVLDCLQKANAIKNDRNCMEIHLRRFIDKQNPRIEFKITPINGNN